MGGGRGEYVWSRKNDGGRGRGGVNMGRKETVGEGVKM